MKKALCCQNTKKKLVKNIKQAHTDYQIVQQSNPVLYRGFLIFSKIILGKKIKVAFEICFFRGLKVKILKKFIK